MNMIRLLTASALVLLANSAHADGWSGFSVGVSGGGASGYQSQQGGRVFVPRPAPVSPPPIETVPADGNYGLTGGLIGGGIGYSIQQGRYVFGLEADGSWARATGSGLCSVWTAVSHACGGGMGALGTVRGKVGYDLGPILAPLGGVMAYVTGGLAVGEVHAWDALFATSGSSVEAGWTVGAGLAVKIAPHWSVKIEYLHVDLGSHAFFTAATFPEHVGTRADLGRVGVNYHLDFGAPGFAAF